METNSEWREGRGGLVQILTKHSSPQSNSIYNLANQLDLKCMNRGFSQSCWPPRPHTSPLGRAHSTKFVPGPVVFVLPLAVWFERGVNL